MVGLILLFCRKEGVVNCAGVDFLVVDENGLLPLHLNKKKFITP